MKSAQRGVSLGGLLVILFILVIVGIMSLKLIPSYMEYYKAKGGISAIARERPNATPADVRKSFDARAVIDDITSIKGQDLDITKEGNATVISFTYRKEIPLFANVGVFIDFAANSKGE